MGRRAGMTSGKVHGRTVTADGKFVANSIWLPANQFQTTFISGTAAIVSSTNLAEYTYAFNASADNSIGFSYVVPTNIQADTKLNVTVYWTSSGVVANDDGVVFDIDYWNFSKSVSGVEVNGVYYILSGVADLAPLGNTTVTGIHRAISGALNNSILTVPAIDVKASEYVRCEFFRDTSESADDLTATAHVIGLLLEFVD